AEKPAYVYVSEISHNYDGKAYCYGGGHYRRSHMENVLVGKDFESARKLKVVAPSEESIDYHYEISEPCEINDCAIMAYRTQVFTTRSHVAVVAGLSEGKPQLLGIYDALGERVNAEWQ
ncbi:MAG: YhfX family PLP-dependent enzyme, partial [Erysipelotrichaceae bacterium]|nr:YhfX family PLP-dependent enzyme [Erysipelotrichaceae bacterium]